MSESTLTATDPRGAHLFGVVPKGIEVAVFLWDAKFGHCYECGLPAAYAIGAAEQIGSELAWDNHQLRCSVCAAMAAYNGEDITWLFEEDYAD